MSTTTEIETSSSRDIHWLAGRSIKLPESTSGRKQPLKKDDFNAKVGVGSTAAEFDARIESIVSVERKPRAVAAIHAALPSSQRNWMDGSVLEYVENGAKVKCELFNGPSDKSLFVVLPANLFQTFQMHFGFPFRLAVEESDGLRRFNVTKRTVVATPEQKSDFKVLFPDTV